VWFGSNKAYWIFHKEVVAVDKWMEDLLCGDLAKETRKEDVGEIMQICWAIWKARNDFVFNNKAVNPEEVIEHASRDNRDYLAAVCMGAGRVIARQVGCSRWEAPSHSCLKINSDGAFNSSRGLAAFGVIARDSGGSAHWWHYGRVKVSSAIVIEAWALRIACAMAEERNINGAIFESDCISLVNSVNDASVECLWEIAVIVEDIRVWASKRHWTFRWCKRECNKAAHWIANSYLNSIWSLSSGCIPPSLESILSKDLS